MISTSKTKTFTIGQDSIKELIYFLEIAQKSLDSNDFNRLSKVDSFISLLKVSPWNEGGYCQDELD